MGLTHISGLTFSEKPWIFVITSWAPGENELPCSREEWECRSANLCDPEEDGKRQNKGICDESAYEVRPPWSAETKDSIKAILEGSAENPEKEREGRSGKKHDPVSGGAFVFSKSHDDLPVCLRLNCHERIVQSAR